MNLVQASKVILIIGVFVCSINFVNYQAAETNESIVSVVTASHEESGSDLDSSVDSLNSSVVIIGSLTTLTLFVIAFKDKIKTN